VCKADKECPITASVRKQCAACRYQKCLSIGMKPELVLDDDEKKTRFRKFLSKKAASPGATLEMPIGRGQPQQRRGRGGQSASNTLGPGLSSEMVQHCLEVKTEVDDMVPGEQMEYEEYNQYTEDRQPHDRRTIQEILWLRLGNQEPLPCQDVDIKQEDEEQPPSVISSNNTNSKLDILAQIAPDELRDYLGKMSEAGNTGSSTSSIMYSGPSPGSGVNVIRHNNVTTWSPSSPSPTSWPHPLPAGSHPGPAGGHPGPAGGHPGPAVGHPGPADGQTGPSEGQHITAEVQHLPVEVQHVRGESQPGPAGGLPVLSIEGLPGPAGGQVVSAGGGQPCQRKSVIVRAGRHLD